MISYTVFNLIHLFDASMSLVTRSMNDTCYNSIVKARKIVVHNISQVIQSDSRIASDHVGLYRKNYRILSDPMEIRRKLPAS